MKFKEKLKAKELRKKGKSINSIAKSLNVSKSSVSLWVRDIKLTENQSKKLVKGRHQNFINGAIKYKEKYRIKRLKYQNDGRIKAKERDVDHIAGCMLYWAEGDKQRNVVGLSNSDINVLKVFLEFLRKYFNVTDDKIAIYINGHISNNITKIDIENYWINNLCLPKNCLRKTILNRYSHFSQRNKIGKIPYGTCKLVVCKTQIVQHIYGAIQEYGNFNNEKWVDL